MKLSAIATPYLFGRGRRLDLSAMARDPFERLHHSARTHEELALLARRRGAEQDVARLAERADGLGRFRARFRVRFEQGVSTWACEQVGRWAGGRDVTESYTETLSNKFHKLVSFNNV